MLCNSKEISDGKKVPALQWGFSSLRLLSESSSIAR